MALDSSMGVIKEMVNLLPGSSNRSTVVGVRGNKCVVWARERSLLDEQQDNSWDEKIRELDVHVAGAYASLSTDAYMIMNMAQVECQCHRLLYYCPIPVESMAKYIGKLTKDSSSTFGVGVTCLVGGCDLQGTSYLYATDPSGEFVEWKATAIGNNSPAIHDFLQAIDEDRNIQDVDDVIKLALKGLRKVTTNSNCFEVAVLEYEQPLKMLDAEAILGYINAIEQEEENEGSNQQ